ncbi:MAG: hypothetical protein E6R06_29780 [Mycobacterium sp.]|jgi:hypothetical protein|nr:MAG: hypothetical protein E6R06_29780 [Mycobacterium sp.]
MTEPNHIAIRIPQPKTGALTCAIAFTLLLMVLAALAAVPMHVPNGNCGTIFASSDTWKYNSHVDAANAIARKSVHSRADLDNFASTLVDNMMNDLASGSAVYDQCKERHATRLIWISLVGATAALLAVGALYFGRRHRRAARLDSGRPNDTDEKSDPTASET